MKIIEVHYESKDEVVSNLESGVRVPIEDFVEKYVKEHLEELKVVSIDSERAVIAGDKRTMNEELANISYLFDVSFLFDVREDEERLGIVECNEFEMYNLNVNQDPNNKIMGIQGARGYDVKKEMEEKHDLEISYGWDDIMSLKVSKKI